MKPVYILLTDTGSVLTRIIKRFTRSPYNHVSISFDEDLDTLYSFGRKYPKIPFFAGFVQESIYRGTFRRFKNTQCMILRIDVSDDVYQRLHDNINYFVDHMDEYSYNFIGLIAVAFNRHIPRKHAYFCSEFVAEVLYNSNLNLWETPPYLVKPFDFGLDQRFELVYEGLLKDYAMKHQLTKTM